MARKAIVKWIVVSYKPFQCVEDPALRKVFEILSLGKFKNIDSKAVKIRVHEMAEKEKLKMIETLKDKKVAITSDGWTSCGQDSYISLTAHYIDEN